MLSSIELQARREALGLSRLQFAEMLQEPVKEGWIRAWEAGAKPVYDSERVEKALHALEDLSHFFSENMIERVERRAALDAGIDPDSDLDDYIEILESSMHIYRLVSFGKDAHFWEVHPAAERLIPACVHRAATMRAKDFLEDAYQLQTQMIDWRSLDVEEKIAYETSDLDWNNILNIFKKEA